MPVNLQDGRVGRMLCRISQTDLKTEAFFHESSGDQDSGEHTLGNIATDGADWKEAWLWIQRGLGLGDTGQRGYQPPLCRG